MKPAQPTGWRRSELTYCSNVHPGEQIDAVLSVITRHVSAVRRIRGLDAMSTGLWLSNSASRALSNEQRSRERLAALLDEHGLSLFTLNGFPYGDFHHGAVKEDVYRPDWSEPARLSYTLRLANILAELMPGDVDEGSISTLPLGYQRLWNDVRHDSALRNLVRLALSLAQLRSRTGRRIRVCLEMEPGCVLESTQQLLHLFTEQLPDAADAEGVPHDTIHDHLGVCFDVCHQAVMFEDIGASLDALRAADIAIGKIQLSSALEVELPGDAAARMALDEFAEARYLHQVRMRHNDGTLAGTMDLPEALSGTLGATLPWRVHFHLPVQTPRISGYAVGTTRRELATVFDYLAQHPDMRPHLEVETYTWHVLPERLRPRDDAGLHRGLCQELSWVESQMEERGLLRG